MYSFHFIVLRSFHDILHPFQASILTHIIPHPSTRSESISPLNACCLSKKFIFNILVYFIDSVPYQTIQYSASPIHYSPISKICFFSSFESLLLSSVIKLLLKTSKIQLSKSNRFFIGYVLLSNFIFASSVSMR